MTEWKRAFTHGAKFHADDVFGAALLTYLYPEIEITRGFQVPEAFDGIVFDVGLGQYDHHQEDARVRENGVPYAAFGLLWEQFGAQILGEEEALIFDEKFIQPLDINDNTGEPNEVANLIGLFNPSWDSEEDSDEAFAEAKEFALTILKLKFERSKSIQRAKSLVESALENQRDGILFLDRGMPWKKFVQGTDIEFVVYPSNRGGYNAQAVNNDDEENPGLRIPFPESWRGKTPEEIQQISGIPTIHFCHNSGFLVATATEEDAVLACKKARQVKQIGIE